MVALTALLLGSVVWADASSSRELVARLQAMSMHEAAYAHLIDQAMSSEAAALRSMYELQAGMVLLEAEEGHRAAEHFRQLLSQEELSSPARRGLAWSLYRGGSPGHALSMLSGATSPQDQYLAGWCARSARQPAAALAQWQKIPAADPLHSRAAALTAEISSWEQLPYRSPALAGGLAAVLPGAGHAYAGQWGEATSALFVNGGLLAAGWQLAQRELWFGLGMVAMLELGFYGGNIVSAVGRAKRFNRLAWEEPIQALSPQPSLQLEDGALQIQ